MKVCCSCKQNLSEENFSKNQTRCKLCSSEYHREWRFKNSEYNKKRKKEYSANNREKINKRDLKYRHNNPSKMSARRKIQDGVKDGKILRPDKCENCGIECKPHGHHEDYLKPFDVIWLCKNCHFEIHNRRFVDILINNQKELDPEFSKAVDKHFFDLI